jgi:hypothetical protein
VTFTFAWTISGRDAGTGPTLSSGFSRGDVVAVTATPSDGFASGAPVTQPVQVEDAPPGQPAAALAGGRLGQGLECAVSAPSVDPDLDPVTYAFKWLKNGVPFDMPFIQHAVDRSTIAAADLAPGDRYSCYVVARAAALESPSSLSPEIVVTF